MSTRSDDLSHTRAGPDHWARLLAIDPEVLDVASAREEVLRRLTGPMAGIVLAFYLGIGAFLRMVGLDIARLTGHNAFGLFGLEAAFNGIALLVLSAPLGLFALGTPKARGYQRVLVDWILQGPVGDAYAYIKAIEGETGLIWRFVDNSTRPSLTGNRLGAHGRSLPLLSQAKPEIAALYWASREGGFDSIDLDLYRDIVRSLQNGRTLRESRWEMHGELGPFAEGGPFGGEEDQPFDGRGGISNDGEPYGRRRGRDE